jgi:glycosyltransferase involved in cell wall biosynthesis
MVSVIIPNYNHAPYLRWRIDSVLAQTYQNFELILLDDCSTDNSCEILEEYRVNEKVSHIVYNEKNSGSTFKQWKKGLELAKNKYIWIAESDDIADRYFLEKVIKSILENNSILCFSQSEIIDEHNTTTRSKPAILDEDHISSADFLSRYLLYDNLIYNASMVVFKKDLVTDILWNDLLSLKFCGDWLFWFDILSNTKGEVSEVKEPLNFFRKHSNNVSNRAEVRGLTFLEGFSVSSKIYRTIMPKSEKREFCNIWFEKWQYYRLHYQFTKNTNLNILNMFLFKQPRIAFLEIKRLLLRMFK